MPRRPSLSKRRPLIALPVILIAALLLMASPAAAQHGPIAASPAPTSASSPPGLEGLFRQGDFAALRERALQRDDAPALRMRAELALLDAKGPDEMAEAARLATLARERATTPEEEAAAGLTAARVAGARGDREAAEALLREVLKERPQTHRARLELGLLLLERGARPEAEALLQPLSVFFNNGILESSEELTILARAMAALGSYDDANYALQKAVEADPHNAEALVAWGELLLSKYNTADAERTFEEVLEARPHHVGALVGLARTELELSNDYAKIRELLARAEEVAPGLPELLLTRAEVAIYDEDCPTAVALADRVLEARPKHLEALTIRAACHYLDDDREAFEARIAQVHEINPSYARVLTETARFAVRAHRYEEAVALHRRALELQPEDGPALLGLAIGLSRIGHEDEAFDRLRQAFAVDPYNVRAFNMLELYEKTMPDYEFTSYDGFRIRSHRGEVEAINRFVAPLVERALETYRKKYAFEPADYLAVEFYPDPSTFGVRSVGLPHVSPHGICFGKVVVSRSPSEGNFNWKQVVWHELAHVFHIQMSKARVPRWFTEGLAEYETNVEDPAWSRHHDRELARALRAGNLRGVLELSEGFTHVGSLEEVLQAYHQSSLVVHYIAETYGFDAINAMLRAWGQEKTTPEVLREVLGVEAAALDAGFEKWLSRRYMGFGSQLTVDLAGLPSAAELEQEVRAKPDDGEGWARLAVARYRVGDTRGADEAVARAVQVAPTDPEVNLIATMYLYERGRIKDAYARGLAILDAGRDSHDLRMLLGASALTLERPVEARVHLEAATTLFEDGVEAWRSLGELARARDDEALERRALERVFALDQNDPLVARQLAEAALEEEAWGEAVTAAERWVAIDPFDARAHRARAMAALGAGQVDRALGAWESMLTLRQNDRKEVWLEAIGSLTKRGYTDEAKQMAERARRDGVSQQDLSRALRP